MMRSVVLSSLLGCAFDLPETPGVGPVPVSVAPPLAPPELVAIMRSDLRVGEPLQFAGRGFLDPAEGRVDVTLSGAFEPAGGRPIELSYTVPFDLAAADLVETALGPFRVPFTRAGNQTGTFRGHAFATNRAFDGRARRQDESTWLSVELVVLPSIVIRALAPREDPSLALGPPDVLADRPYFAMIEAVGFEATSIDYRLGSNVLVEGAPASLVTHAPIGPVDVLGESEVISFARVPEGVDRYSTSIVIDARTASGETVTFDLAITVHTEVPVRIAD
jgi:hypothetical protein